MRWVDNERAASRFETGYGESKLAGFVAGAACGLALALLFVGALGWL